MVVVDSPGQHAGARADAAVTVSPGCAVAVRTADCAPIVLVAGSGAAVVHAGWKGLLAGVVARAAATLEGLAGPVLEAHIGPCIRAGCYEFGQRELDAVAAVAGNEVRATTTWGTPALDLPAGVRGALLASGIQVVHDDSGCTACDRRWFSHRARGELERFATVAWLEP